MILRLICLLLIATSAYADNEIDFTAPFGPDDGVLHQVPYDIYPAISDDRTREERKGGSSVGVAVGNMNGDKVLVLFDFKLGAKIFEGAFDKNKQAYLVQRIEGVLMGGEFGVDVYDENEDWQFWDTEIIRVRIVRSQQNREGGWDVMNITFGGSKLTNQDTINWYLGRVGKQWDVVGDSFEERGISVGGSVGLHQFFTTVSGGPGENEPRWSGFTPFVGEVHGVYAFTPSTKVHGKMDFFPLATFSGSDYALGAGGAVQGRITLEQRIGKRFAWMLRYMYNAEFVPYQPDQHEHIVTGGLKYTAE